jgi:nucleotide-binding universal stress UspA family protein
MNRRARPRAERRSDRLRRRLHLARRHARRLARRAAAARYRTIIVPLLDFQETEHPVDLACQIAVDRGARLFLVAPLVVDTELPLNAHFPAAIPELRARIELARNIAESYGIRAHATIVRTRERALGHELAVLARDYRAELIVVGAQPESRRGFRRPFPPETLSILREAPCRVMLTTGPTGGHAAPPEPPSSTGYGPAPSRTEAASP